MKLRLAFILFSLVCKAQTINYQCDLSSDIGETSGLIYLDDRIISHNDSGGANKLYELDSISGNIIRDIYILNSTNTDWEDLCFDEEYIYIADIGNNAGNRHDLKIYKLSIEDYLLNDTVYAETISFSYENQSNFENQQYSTNFDAEGIISMADSLYIFTKNWGNGYTNIYRLPKTPGNYDASKIDSINSQGLVTSATYNPNTNQVYLTGYNLTSPFLIKLSSFHSGLFSNGTIEKNLIETTGSFQVEAIAHKEGNYYLLSAESNGSYPASLHSFYNTNLSTELQNENRPFAYPNPTNNILLCELQEGDQVKLYNITGELIYNTNRERLYLASFSKGVYILSIEREGIAISKQRIILE